MVNLPGQPQILLRARPTRSASRTFSDTNPASVSARHNLPVSAVIQLLEATVTPSTPKRFCTKRGSDLIDVPVIPS
jgi:hypothetical protein